MVSLTGTIQNLVNGVSRGEGTLGALVTSRTLYDELKQFTAGAPKLDDVITTSILEATKDARAKIG